MKPFFVKKLFILILPLLLLIQCQKDNEIIDNEPLIPGWRFEALPFNLNIAVWEMIFVNPSTGYLTGDNGAIYITHDSARTWQPQSSGTTLNLYSASFVNENIGFISGPGINNCLDADCNKGGIFLKTSDGGTHWEKSFYDSSVYMEPMYFSDNENGIGIMNLNWRPGLKNNYLVKTSDGGNTWQDTGFEIPQRNYMLFERIDDTFYMAGDSGKILKSNDFGATWDSYATPLSDDIGYQYYINSEVGFVGDYLNTYKTNDGGLTWHQVQNLWEWAGYIHFSDGLHGIGFEMIATYEGGDFPNYKGTHIRYTMNGGVTWDRSGLYTELPVLKIYFPTPDFGYMLSNNVIYRMSR